MSLVTCLHSQPHGAYVVTMTAVVWVLSPLNKGVGLAPSASSTLTTWLPRSIVYSDVIATAMVARK